VEQIIVAVNRTHPTSASGRCPSLREERGRAS